MRSLAIDVCCALLAGMACAECLAPESKESSSHVRIVVVLGGKPLKGVKIDFHYMKIDSQDQGARSVFSALTDENGIVTPPELALGNYEVVATLHEVVSTTLWLYVDSNDGMTSFSMDLTDPVQRVEKLLVNDHLKAFQGTVTDPTGAVILGTNILVVKKGSKVQDIVFKAKADPNGHFSEQLAEGSYIAFFFTPGFRVAIVPFEVTKDGSGDLKVALMIGHC